MVGKSLGFQYLAIFLLRPTSRVRRQTSSVRHPEPTGTTSRHKGKMFAVI